MMRVRLGRLPMVSVGRPARSASVTPPAWPHAPFAVAVRAGLQSLVFPLLGRLIPTEIIGREHLDALDGPVLFVANHVSHLDTPVLLRALPKHRRRRIAVAAAHDYFYGRALTGAFVGLTVGAFPLARSGNVRPALAHCAQLQARGWSMLLYPEGTRSTTGAPGPLKPGAGALALKLGLPVVPIRTRGLFEVLPKGRTLLRPGRVSVHVGPPLTFDPATPSGVVTARIAAALDAL